MINNLIVGILSTVIGGLILAGLLAALNWELKRIGGDLSAIRSRVGLWFYTHLKQILVVGLLANAFLLAWVLLRFPTVNIWSVLAIVISVVLMALEIGVFLLIRTLEGVINAISRYLKNWAKNQPDKNPKV
jgi:hypothetical protein